ECQRNYRDIYIEVEETDTGNLGLFFGFSSLDRIFGGIEISERNFNIAGIPRVIQDGPSALRGAGEFAYAKINIGDRHTVYTVQWNNAYCLDSPWVLGIHLENIDHRALPRAYDVKTYGGNVEATSLINLFLKYDIYFRARHSRINIKAHNVERQDEGNKSG